MTAHRGVDPATHSTGPDQLVVKRLAHAVEALELVIVSPGPTHGPHGRQGVGVMGGELGVDAVPGGQEAAGAGQIGKVGMSFAGIDRIVGEALDLGPLDFRVPIGALHEADQQASARLVSRGDEPIENGRGTLLIGLDDEADPVPAGQAGLGEQHREEVQARFQAFGLLGVDMDGNVVLAGQLAEPHQAGGDLGHEPLRLRPGVAGVEGGNLDRDAMGGDGATAPRLLADGMDGGFVGLKIGLGVRRVHGGFAKHVEGIEVALVRPAPATVEGFVDGVPGDELLAQKAHGQIHGAANEGFAAAPQQAPQRCAQPPAAVFVPRHQAAGDQEPPGGGIDEERGAVAQVLLPMPQAELVANQAVCGGAIGNAQKGFRQAHEGHAFLAGEGELLHQGVDPAGPGAGRPQPLDESTGQRDGFSGLGVIEAGVAYQRRQAFRFGRAPMAADALAKDR